MYYTDYTAYDLLETLELSGRHPDHDLLRAILERREETVPGLLEMLAEGGDPDWAEDDPRWYREVHAGLLLIEMREEQALPVFEAILRDEEREDVLSEWFNKQLPRYGAPAIPMLTRVAEDEEAPHWSRIGAAGMLGDVGKLYPETRDEVLPALRRMLPPLREDGSLELPEEDLDALWDDQVEFWTFVIWSLLELRDEESRPHVETLYEAELVDDSIIGDVDAYRKDLAAAPREEKPKDLFAYYTALERVDSRTDEEWDELFRQGLLEAGVDEEEIERLIEKRRAGGLKDELVAQMARERTRQMLLDAGVGEEELDEAVEEVMQNLEERIAGMDLENMDDAEFAEALGVPPFERVTTYVHETPKYGRNERVTIQDPDSGETLTLKYKHAEKRLQEGWQIVS